MTTGNFAPPGRGLRIQFSNSLFAVIASEAKQSMQQHARSGGLLRRVASRNDVETQFRIPAAPRARVAASTSRPLKSEGAGNAGRAMRPQPCVRNKKAHKHSHHGHTGITRHSPRNGFTAYTALSPVTGLSCHRRLRSCPHRLDASVGASGPHDFAVRKIAPSSEAPPRVHRIPPRVRDDREPPLQRDGTGRGIRLICISEKQKYFFEKGWTGSRIRNHKRRPTGKSPASASVARRSKAISGCPQPAWRCAYGGYSLSRRNGPHRSAL
jgi:hypothetical protein